MDFLISDKDTSPPMRIPQLLLASLWWLALLVSSLPSKAAETVASPDEIRLVTLDGLQINLAKHEKSKSVYVLAFLGNECPVARAYAMRLNEMAGQLAGKGVQFIGINSNPHDSEIEVRRFVKELSIVFPFAKDHDQSLAKRFNATRTAEVVVLDTNRNVAYRGRIDDQFSPGIKRASPTRLDLYKALEELVAGEPVSFPSTQPVGCLITFREPLSTNSGVTFCKDVAPILYSNCLECHRSGEIGPFDISSYEEVVGWANMIVEVVEQGRMPPWHADPEYGLFKNARQMPPEALSKIREWISAGMPYGNSDQLPEKPNYLDGWRLPKEPDLVVLMREKPYAVAANGFVDYQYFVIDPGLDEDKWISSAQVIPGATEVVHHAIVFVRPPDGEDFNGIGWLTAYVPGQRATEFPEGFARRIPAGSKLVFQMHYTPDGKEHFDQTKIGLNFMDEASVTHEVLTLAGIDQEFEIPPNVADFAVVASVPRLPKDGILLAAMPHMHLRGKSFQMRLRKAGVESVVLQVPHYDFNWQHTYEWTEPIPLSEIEQISFTATFDNSRDNPFNPNPDDYVMWGDQTWEEMAVAFFEVAVPRSLDQSDTPHRVADSKRGDDVPDVIHGHESLESIAFADAFLARFDSNQDASVVRAEVPRIIRDYSFGSIDSNSDGKVTREELVKSFGSRLGSNHSAR